MESVFDALNSHQSSALIEEAQSVANLLRDGILAIRRLREPTVHQDAVFSLTSIGVERLLKIAVGIHFLDKEGRWPSVDEMKKFGHNLGDLQTKVLEIIDIGGEHNQYVRERVEFLKSSPTLTALLNALSHYGQGGRFFNLNVLGDAKRSEKYISPSEHWELIELTVLAEYPELQTVIDEDFEGGLASIAEQIAALLDKWWFSLHRVMLNAALGPYGKQLGWLVWEVDRPDPFSSN